MKLRFIAAMIGMCGLVISACTQEQIDALDPNRDDTIDRPQKLNREDYRNMWDPKGGKAGSQPLETQKDWSVSTQLGAPPIPEVSEILAAPRPPQIGEAQLVSITVTDDVPLKDVLIELARLADVDIELDAGITGGISFRAKEKPFNEVIERIADLADLRYSMKDGVLRVERDTPYVQSYSLDFLNMVRNSTSNVNISTSVLSSVTGGEGGGGSSGGGLNTGATSSITTTTDDDFWTGFESSVREILRYRPMTRVSQSLPTAFEDPFAEPVSEQTATTAADGSVPATPQASAAAGSNGSAATTAAAAPAATPAPAPVAAPAAPTGTGTDLNGGENPFYVVNRRAGVLTVSGSERQHAMVKRFLDKVRTNSSAQVLIEAKIVEVTLNDQYSSGIDWSALTGDNFGISTTFAGGSTTAANIFTISGTEDRALNLDGIVRLVQTFGTTRTLSSPRLHAINNQEAVLTFAKNQVYFDLDVEREEDTTNGVLSKNLTVNSTVHTVPIGIIMSIRPSINLESNEVTLNVRPTLSRTEESVPDPAVAFLATEIDDPDFNISNDIPIIEVRELDSILKLGSGQVMVIGGLMEQGSNNTDTGIPGLARIPFFGNAFKGVSKQSQNKELVIFIRATITGSSGNADKADKLIYEKFFNDPRPIAF